MGVAGGAIGMYIRAWDCADTMAVWANKTYLLYVERGASLSYLEVLVGSRQRVTQTMKKPSLN
jgi:hypothetical protein